MNQHIKANSAFKAGSAKEANSAAEANGANEANGMNKDLEPKIRNLTPEIRNPPLEIRNLHGLTDTHAHLSYLGERGIPAAALLDGLFAAGFGFILDIGTDGDDLTPRIAQFAGYPNVRFACGIWPYKDRIGRIQEGETMLRRQIEAAPPGAVVAVGECGFDLRENPGMPPEEAAFFEMQLSLAQEYNVPVIVHSREAAVRTIETLRRFPAVTGVIHCFSYTKAEAQTFLDMGYYISFAGNLTFKNAAALREAAAFIPDGRLLLETDSPFLAPMPYRGGVCHPGMVRETYQCAAGLRGTDLAGLKETVRQNARRLFYVGI
ncbi:MAG: TatD family hydrolase [Spirochaetaceae bacterium]|jgi:TatD DNase family protein|nr:TatD family hydrolase [Spirochaetaceae bacterium]